MYVIAFKMNFLKIINYVSLFKIEFNVSEASYIDQALGQDIKTEVWVIVTTRYDSKFIYLTASTFIDRSSSLRYD